MSSVQQERGAKKSLVWRLLSHFAPSEPRDGGEDRMMQVLERVASELSDVTPVPTELLARLDRLATTSLLATGLAHELANPLASLVLSLDWTCERVERHAQAGQRGRRRARTPGARPGAGTRQHRRDHGDAARLPDVPAPERDHARHRAVRGEARRRARDPDGARPAGHRVAGVGRSCKTFPWCACRRPASRRSCSTSCSTRRTRWPTARGARTRSRCASTPPRGARRSTSRTTAPA